MRLIIVQVRLLVVVMAAFTSISCSMRCGDGVKVAFESAHGNSSYTQMMQQFNDTLRRWYSMKIGSIYGYEADSMHLGGVLITSDGLNSLVYCLFVDPDTLSTYNTILTFAGEKVGGTWHFYSGGLTTYVLQKTPRGGKAIDSQFEDLEDLLVDKVCTLGWVDFSTQMTNDALLKELFGPKLYRAHQAFLRN